MGLFKVNEAPNELADQVEMFPMPGTVPPIQLSPKVRSLPVGDLIRDKYGAGTFQKPPFIEKRTLLGPAIIGWPSVLPS